MAITEKNAIEIIRDLVKNDQRNARMQTELLFHFYDEATPSQQKVINNIMVCIFGYSLETVINHPENIRKF